MLCDEDCRTAGFGKTERPVGWEGNGETSCKTNEALHWGNLAVTDRLLLPMPNHSFTLDVILVCRGNAEQALQAFEAIAQRMELTLNREKTRITKVADGFDFIGFHFVKRRSGRSGKPTIYIQPSQTAQRRIRQQIRQITSRRAPISPNEWLQRISLIVRGWVNYYRHTSASQAFRRLQHFINTRFRRYLSYRSKRRGFGWDRYPDWKLYAMGMIYIASGLIKYENRTVNALR